MEIYRFVILRSLLDAALFWDTYQGGALHKKSKSLKGITLASIIVLLNGDTGSLDCASHTLYTYPIYWVLPLLCNTWMVFLIRSYIYIYD